MNALTTDLIPRQHLDTVFETVTAAAERLPTPRPTGDLTLSLRHSLRYFVRAELRSALSIVEDTELLPEPLRRHVAEWQGQASAASLRAFACRRGTQWCSTLLELLERLHQDWPLLVGHFDLTSDASLQGVSPALGDLHHDGRAVYRVLFSDGKSLIYKPRSVETEHAFAALLGWLRDNGCDPDFKACQALPRNGYGWTEYVPTVFCETATEIEAFYRRQGGFLALFWLLCAGDAIGDNVIVAGEHPVWVDSECLSRPDLCDILKGRMSFPVWIRESMLVTAMVLYGVAPRNARHFRGQTGLNVSCTKNRSHAFTATDVLRAPLIRAVVEGFQDVYRWFLAHEDARSHERGPLAICRDKRVRVILRSTQFYSVLLKVLAVTPEAAKADVLEDICNVLRAGDQPHSGPFPEGVVQAEIQALKGGDIPYWSASTSSRDLWEANGGCVRRAASATCIECIYRRMVRVSESDLARQVWLLECFLGGGGREDAMQ